MSTDSHEPTALPQLFYSYSSRQTRGVWRSPRLLTLVITGLLSTGLTIANLIPRFIESKPVPVFVMHAGFDCDPETWIAHEYTYGFPFTHLRGTLRGNGTSMFGMEKSKKRYHPAILMANFALALAALMVLAMVCEFVIPARWVTANFYLALALVGILCACVLWIWWESHVTPLWRPSSGDFLLVIQLTSIGLLFVVCLCTVIRHVFNRAGDSGGRERLVR